MGKKLECHLVEFRFVLAIQKYFYFCLAIQIFFGIPVPRFGLPFAPCKAKFVTETLNPKHYLQF